MIRRGLAFGVAQTGNVTATVSPVTPLAITDDSADAGDETVILRLTSATGYTVGSRSGPYPAITDDNSGGFTASGQRGSHSVTIADSSTAAFTVSGEDDSTHAEDGSTPPRCKGECCSSGERGGYPAKKEAWHLSFGGTLSQQMVEALQRS